MLIVLIRRIRSKELHSAEDEEPQEWPIFGFKLRHVGYTAACVLVEEDGTIGNRYKMLDIHH